MLPKSVLSAVEGELSPSAISVFSHFTVISGMAVTITISLLLLSEFAAPGVANVNDASFPLTSFMVPPFNAKAFVLV
jgi:hypothetical protein